MVERAASTGRHDSGERSEEGVDNRRRHARYRFSEPITLRPSHGSPKAGMTLEISVSGVSIMTAAPLAVGEILELDSIAGGRALATVRHNAGSVFGFEFLNLTAEQTHSITDACTGLPRYRNSLSI